MTAPIIEQHYKIPDLNFQDFWEICSRFQTVHPECSEVHFTVEGVESLLILDEPEVSRVLKKLQGKETLARKFTARLYALDPESEEPTGITEISYNIRPQTKGKPQQLSIYTECSTRQLYHHFEEELYNSYRFIDEGELEFEFGTPCEVLALVIDIRGFSTFCEQPGVESPYTCALMSAFYNMVTHSLKRFPPEMIKFLGDGVLAIWRTNPEDREIAVHIALSAALELDSRWKEVKDDPYFTHGTPEGIGAGISFGLASHIEVGNDYIGRPINIASRLCSACPAKQVYVDRIVPNIPLHLKKHEYVAHIRPYGRHEIWAFSDNHLM